MSESVCREALLPVLRIAYFFNIDLVLELTRVRKFNS